MKIKCNRIYNEHTNQPQDSSPWLTIGKEYIVLEIEIYSGESVLYRMIGDNTDFSPALYDSKQFEIVSDKLPSNWKIQQLSSGILNIGPESWQTPGFWEACYDGDTDQLEIYKKEARFIFDDENENYESR